MGVMSIAEIMDESIGILKKNFKTFILYNLGYGIVGFVGFMIVMVGAILLGVLGATFLGPAGIVVPMSIVALLSAAYYTSLTVGIVKIASQDIMEENEKVLAFDAVKFSMKHIFKVMGYVMALFVLMLPLLLVIGLIFYAIYKTLDTTTIIHSITTLGEVGLGFLIIILTMIMIFVTTLYLTLFTFAIPAIVVERIGVIKSLKRSYQLVKVNLWKIIGFNAIMFFTIYVLRISASSFVLWIVGIFMLILEVLNVNQDYLTILSLANSVARAPLEIISYFIFTPISTIMITLLYFNQRFKLEGLDLQIKLKSIKKKQERNLTQ